MTDKKKTQNKVIQARLPSSKQPYKQNDSPSLAQESKAKRKETNPTDQQPESFSLTKNMKNLLLLLLLRYNLTKKS